MSGKKFAKKSGSKIFGIKNKDFIAEYIKDIESNHHQDASFATPNEEFNRDNSFIKNAMDNCMRVCDNEEPNPRQQVIVFRQVKKKPTRIKNSREFEISGWGTDDALDEA